MTRPKDNTIYANMEKIYEEIYEIHSQRIVFGDIASQPALIVFSAVPGSGKTELTRRLVDEYGFSKIANKDIRWAIEEFGHKDDVLVAEYTLWLLDKISNEKPPLRIVFDRNIDQWYEPSKVWATQHNYKYVLIRIDVHRNILERRLQTREAGHTEHVFSVLGFYEDQHRKLSKSTNADITLEGDYDLDLAAELIAKSST